MYRLTRYAAALLAFGLFSPDLHAQSPASPTFLDLHISGTLSLTGTGATQLNKGTTAQQPDSGNAGEVRYNSDTGRYEFGIGGSWVNHVRLSGDTLGTATFTGGTFSGANITLPGGTWGSGTLVNQNAPLFQNATISGTTVNASAGLGAFLQQTDNSVCGSNSIPCAGVTENLTMGTTAQFARVGGQFIVTVPVVTAGGGNPQYIGLEGKCTLGASDGSGHASCFGFNSIAHIAASVTALQAVGAEFGTWVASTATVTDRIGVQIVDVTGASFGGRASRDDVALSLNNQYAPSSSLGFATGLDFGRSGGNFPILTTGTMIHGQGASGAAFTVAKGIDWSLGTATASWLNLGGVFTVDGSGNTTALTYKVGSNQVVRARITGWGAASNGARTAFNGSTATLAQTSAAVAQLIADLTTHGLIGP